MYKVRKEGLLMKLSNPLIIFDLECTSNQETSSHKPKNQKNEYIIEIGATLLDTNLKIKSQFSSLVRPEEKITPFIEGITKISNDMVKNKNLWPDVSQEFYSWASKNTKNMKHVRLASWGNYFDITVLRNVYEKYGLEYPWSGTALDCKTIAATWMALSGRGTSKLSLGYVANCMGVEPEGEYHRALTDAMVTAKIVKRCFEDLSQGYFLKTGSDQYRHIKIKT
jgi:DNA polymerase III epsilon subunit-like protein